ncbi:hypothetical protein N9L76_08715 [bacterium]|nr:hypothetical protein [bacterium]
MSTPTLRPNVLRRVAEQLAVDAIAARVVEVDIRSSTLARARL